MSNVTVFRLPLLQDSDRLSGAGWGAPRPGRYGFDGETSFVGDVAVYKGMNDGETPLVYGSRVAGKLCVATTVARPAEK